MRNVFLVHIAFMLCFLTACDVNSDLDLLSENELADSVIFSGNVHHSFSTEYSSPSRSDAQSLVAGNEISVYSTGAFQADALVLRYDGAHWKGNDTYRWAQASGSANVVAYYPAITSFTPAFYNDKGLLQDFCYSKGTYTAGQIVQLDFSHLFSEISFQFCQSINDDLTEVRFLISKKVSTLDCYTSEYVLQDNLDQYISFSQNTSGNYTFLVPSSASNIDILIEVHTRSGKIRKTTLSRPFSRNVTYRCNINERKNQAGIYTADDFIAFVQLYNGDRSSGRSLSEFYIMEQGKRVYKLMNSISFTPEQSAKVTEIGYFNIKQDNLCHYFSDVFDGQHFTLYGLNLVNRKSESAGLFACNSGIIRNLVIDNMHISTQVDVAHTISPLCGKSRGVIHDCMVRNTEVQTLSKNIPSGFVGVNGTGAKLYNCGVENTTISQPANNDMMSAGMVYDNYGLLLNSYVSDCNLSRGSFLCYENFYVIRGCYTYSSAVVNNSSLVHTIPAICYINYPAKVIWECYFQFPYEENYIHSNQADKSYTLGIRYRHEDFMTPKTDTHPDRYLVDRLNGWIDSYGNKHYTGLTFTRWTKAPGSNRPAFVR